MDYRKVLESRYNRAAWETLLHDIFGNRVTIREAYPVDVDHNVARQAYYLGKITLADGQMIAIYEVQLTERVHIYRNRAQLRNLLVSQWRNSGYAGAFMLCYHSDESILRFSYVSETYRFDEDKHYTKDSTDTKRFTYLLGEGMACRTAVERFSQLRSSGQTLDDVTRAFSVEVLTKQFYNELFEWYGWAVSDDSGVYFPNNVTTATDDREDLETKIIRLITRIMFVWFIRQKNLVPAKLFDVSFLKTILKDFDPQATDNGNYYNAILQNLFFATLNRAIVDEDGNTRKFAYLKGQRDTKTLYRYAEMFSISEKQVIDLFSSVPFLNGGLFECLDKTQKIDGVDVNYNYDGFSRSTSRFPNGHYRQRAFIPNILFFKPDKGLFSILSRYNFTIEENTPDDQQVALDPELLGKVFENLLGAYNPETRETARNQSGSFYTPREIVNYMVDESLISYLGGGDAVRVIFSDDFVYQDKDKELYKEITDKLKAVKVLDPACGSGAFPMGMLNRIVDILKKLNHEQDVYDLKLHVIENCIYGCDIQSIAAQITKLRFFISLICDCDKDSSKPNFGIPTLPNLETKFVSADSLIALKRGYYVQGNLFIDTDVVRLKGELQNVRHQHFMAKTAAQKKRLREKDETLRTQLSQILKGQDTQLNAAQLVKWNPYDQNAVADFFDPEWMFGLKEGFDIVIGNPPYKSTKTITVKEKKAYEQSLGFSDDTYNLFTFRGMQLTKSGGSLNYIIPKTFWTTQTKRNMRDLLLSKQINYIFDTANPFDAVMVDTCIIQVQNRDYDGTTPLKFLDGSKDLSHPIAYPPISQKMYQETQNSVIFKPTQLNMRIWELYGKKVKELYDTWWDKIETSKKIKQNEGILKEYRESLKPGDIALLGCLTEGGQGLATANNGKYIAVRKSSKWAANIIKSRPKKLRDAIKKFKGVANELGDIDCEAFLASKSEKDIAILFDNLKSKYGRDIFGQGYIYKLIDDSEIADVNSLTEDEKENGISIDEPYYVPYDKGDKDGNRWYLETPFAIAWSKENVRFLKTNSGKSGQGMPVVRNPQYYFKEGFCWSDINTHYLKCRLKGKSVNDVKSMSLYGLADQVPEYYIIALINSKLMSIYVDNFVNNTQTFQINDARQLPIIVPDNQSMFHVQVLFNNAVRVKKLHFEKKLNTSDTEESLSVIQKELDDLINVLYSI